MELQFKPITLDDKELITSYTYLSAYRNCDFAFANMCSWRFLYGSEFTVINGFMAIRFRIEHNSQLAYMMPAGKGNLNDIIPLLEADARQQGSEFCLVGITPKAKVKLEVEMPGALSFVPERDYFDYVYLRENLATLTGKKYQSKRNHINNFKKQYTYQYLPITDELIGQCLQLECKWYRANHTEADAEDLNDERRSMIYALNNFKALGLEGGALCVEGKVIAFTYGSPINPDTFCVHVEKADVNYEGAYTVINQEFASRIPGQYTYINREEDLGIPGLRQAKLSYKPIVLLEKYAATRKG
ncbi:MAG: phosphatidylglycerol lysyltransferase domain-containing protein [Tannerellaceae bacterium]|nr:phosphatidylglycerol lysyltransferase domain-containing protein [Tannerellaceae bacterium]